MMTDKPAPDVVMVHIMPKRQCLIPDWRSPDRSKWHAKAILGVAAAARCGPLDSEILGGYNSVPSDWGSGL